jgi:hypothetical protein
VTVPVDDIAARINAIQTRFGAYQTAAPAQSSSSAPFSQMLAAASVDSTDPTASLTAAGYGAVGDSGSTSGSDVVSAAMKYLNVPYLWGGTDPNVGLDCSGLVQRAYADLGIQLPRVAADQARQGTPVASLADAKPGDLVAFGSPVDHIGIYAGNGKMVVAPHRNDVVKVQDITVTPTTIRRILPDGGATSFSLSGLLGAVTTAAPAAASGTASSPYDALFAAAGAKYGVSPQLLSAVARAESGYNPSATSGAGALGLMQIMPSTAASLGVDPMNPVQAIDGAARILAGNLSKFGGSVQLAVAAYNAGAGAVSRYNGIPPYAETQNYVRRVLSYAGLSPAATATAGLGTAGLGTAGLGTAGLTTAALTTAGAA